MPTVKPVGRRLGWGEVQFRRQLDESNGDPIPAPVALYVQVPALPDPDSVSHLAWIRAQCTQIGKLLDPDRAPQILCLEILDQSVILSAQLVDLIEHLRTVFVRRQTSDCVCMAIIPAHDAPPDLIECLVMCGASGLVVRTDRPCPGDGKEHGCIICQTARMPDIRGRFELVVQVAMAEPSLTPLGLAAIAQAECTTRADRVIFVPPLTPNWKWPRGAAPQAYVAAYIEACRRLEAAGFIRQSPMEFARTEAPERDTSRGSLWGPAYRHIGIGIGADAQSYVNEWVFRNEPDIVRFNRSISFGGLGVAHGTFLTADERLRLGIIYDVLTRGVIDIDRFAAQHAVNIGRPLLKNAAHLSNLAARGIVTTERGSEVEFAPHAILHAAEICRAFG